MTGEVRVLFVEDNALLAEAIAEFLKLSGLEVSIAETGEDALQAVRSFRPDIVLRDLSLPDMSGLDLLRVLRSSPVAKDAVLAVHTAMSEFDLRTIERQTDVQIPSASSTLGNWTSFVYKEHMRQRRLSCSFASMAFQRFASFPGLMQ